MTENLEHNEYKITDKNVIAEFNGSGSGSNSSYEVQGYYELGIDVGAIATKVILLEDGKKVAGSMVHPTSMEPNKLVEGMVTSLLEDHDLSLENIRHTVATGRGRKAIGFADMARTEITAFAKGAHFLYPEVRIAVDIGGQGIRVMKVGEMGIITDFRTNDKCSSGTGCFMDTMAVALEVGIDSMGEFSLDALHPETISTTCTVFAESEVVSLVAKGKSKEDIIAGLNSMVARKIAALINATRSHGPVFLGGGVALNNGIIMKLKEYLGREIFVPPDPQLVGAIGAAFMAPKPEDDEEDDEGEFADDRGGREGRFADNRDDREGEFADDGGGGEGGFVDDVDGGEGRFTDDERGGSQGSRGRGERRSDRRSERKSERGMDKAAAPGSSLFGKLKFWRARK